MGSILATLQRGIELHNYQNVGNDVEF